MAVIRVNKTKDYTIMSNRHFRDKNLSLKAKGLLSQMLSLPDDWDYSVQGLVAINSDGITIIENALRELKKAGYLIVTKKMPNETATGRIEYIYDVYETPQGIEKQEVEKQGVEKLPIEFQGVENLEQYNTNKQIIKNKKLNNQILNISEIEEEWNDFVAMRKAIKKPLTDRAKEMILKKLQGMGDIETQKQILNQSILHNWQDVYPLKEDRKPYKESIGQAEDCIDFNATIKQGIR